MVVSLTQHHALCSTKRVVLVGATSSRSAELRGLSSHHSPIRSATCRCRYTHIPAIPPHNGLLPLAAQARRYKTLHLMVANQSKGVPSALKLATLLHNRCLLTTDLPGCICLHCSRLERCGSQALYTPDIFGASSLPFAPQAFVWPHSS